MQNNISVPEKFDLIKQILDNVKILIVKYKKILTKQDFIFILSKYYIF